MFQQKSTRGWWPCLSNNANNEKRENAITHDAKKKNDDYNEDKTFVTGAIELEIDLLSALEAKRDSVGKKRKKPNHVINLKNNFFKHSKFRARICQSQIAHV